MDWDNTTDSGNVSAALNTTEATLPFSSLPLANSSSISSNSSSYNSSLPGHVLADDHFNDMVLKFGLSILVVGCLLLAALVSIFVLGVARKRVKKALERHAAARQFNYDSQVDILDEGGPELGGGVLVIHGTEPLDPKATLSTEIRSGSGHGYEATAMAKYMQRRGLPKAVI